MIRREEDRPARDGKYPIELWPCSDAGSAMVYPQAGRRWQQLDSAAVPILFGDLFRAADPWVEILHVAIEPSGDDVGDGDGAGGNGIVRVDVSVRAVMPPDFPPRGYYPSTLLLDFLHSWRDSLVVGEGAMTAPRLPLIIGVNRGGMFWRMTPQHIGRPTPISV